LIKFSSSWLVSVRRWPPAVSQNLRASCQPMALGTYR
jgi:hypothetical protein